MRVSVPPVVACLPAADCKARSFLLQLAPDFEVLEFIDSGSQANLNACMHATDYDGKKIAVAAGTYLSTLQASPLNRFRVHQQVEQGWGQRVTQLRQAIPTADPERSPCRSLYLPYMADCLLQGRGGIQLLEEAETAALTQLKQLLHEGTKCLLIELVCSATGFSLRKSFLDELVSTLHGAGAFLVVDEILTAGRCSSDHLLLSDHLELKADYVTLGKFTRSGIILKRCGVREAPRSVLAPESGGVSGSATLKHTAEALGMMADAIMDKALDVESARKGMLLHLQKYAPDTGLVHWGMGAMVFANIAEDRPETWVGRYLPLVHIKDHKSIPIQLDRFAARPTRPTRPPPTADEFVDGDGSNSPCALIGGPANAIFANHSSSKEAQRQDRGAGS